MVRSVAVGDASRTMGRIRGELRTAAATLVLRDACRRKCDDKLLRMRVGLVMRKVQHLLAAPEPFGAFAAAFELGAADVFEEPALQLAQSPARR